MTLRVKLTLGSVALATSLVTVLSAVGLVNLMQMEFRNTLGRAELVKQFATDAVIDALNRQSKLDLNEAVRDPALDKRLREILSRDKSVLDIMLVSAETNLVLVSALGRVKEQTVA